MEYIAQDLTELVGHTPLLEASRFAQPEACCRLLCKLESLNPRGKCQRPGGPCHAPPGGRGRESSLPRHHH